MIGRGGECPSCGERHGFTTSCLCPVPGERCSYCDGYLDGGMPECSCAPDDDDPAERELRRRELAEARDAAEDDGRDW